MSLEVASTILAQLGGNKFCVMVGAKNLVGSEKSLSFVFMGGKCCKITLNSLDLYDIEFFKVRKHERKVSASFQDIGCEDLRRIFEETTGLVTRLF
jgi:hypothetical protein